MGFSQAQTPWAVIVGALINPKLAPRYYEPFQVLSRVAAVAYKLRLPEAARIRFVFHVSLLKKVVGEYSVEELRRLFLPNWLVTVP